MINWVCYSKVRNENTQGFKQDGFADEESDHGWDNQRQNLSGPGNKVLLNRDLIELYGVETRVLKQEVRRNIKRFPDDFMFELTKLSGENMFCATKVVFYGAILAIAP